MTDLDAHKLSGILRGEVFGKKIHFLEEVDSTNNYAVGLAVAGAEEGEAVIADRQTRGKGRLDRVWMSPPGKNLYLTVILRPRISPSVSPQITLTAGVAAAEVLSGYCGDGVSLKWPNDVLIRGRKACGILTEMRLSGAEVDFVVVGTGININMDQADFDDSFGPATSLKVEVGREVSRFDVALKLLRGFGKWYRIFLEEGFSPVREKWMASSGMLGRRIEVRSKDTVEKGIFEGLDEKGALLLLDEEKERRHIISGDVVLAEDWECCL
ncbi:MAG: biotin--[acetyl-CoA-carboxylase] ligase [Syntrophobacterales bacterium]|nr:biotin--[acetyl-CoA-carboxylase] ligase [Syntrophobacterales bacterium]